MNIQFVRKGEHVEERQNGKIRGEKKNKEKVVINQFMHLILIGAQNF